MSDMINELSSGEDEFDVDLMAAGCRIAMASMDIETMGTQQLVELYGFGAPELMQLIDKLTAKGIISVQDVFAAAEEVSSARPA